MNAEVAPWGGTNIGPGDGLLAALSAPRGALGAGHTLSVIPCA